MKKLSAALSFVVLSAAASVFGAEGDTTPEKDSQVVKTTYLITGLHCPPCTKTVESSLQQVKGIRSVKVDWKTKNARLEFDETVLPAQKLSQLIAETPHMMGSKMHYEGWLVLKVSDIKDDATAKPVEEVLGKVEGVKRVVAYPAQHSVGIQFAEKGEVTTKQLIEALKQAGLIAST